MAWINSYALQHAIYTVPGRSGRVRSGSALRRGPRRRAVGPGVRAGIPIPANAVPAPEPMATWSSAAVHRHHVGTVDRAHEGSTGRLMGRKRCRTCLTIRGTSRVPRLGTAATSLALLGGTITRTELRSGHIGHALSSRSRGTRRRVRVSGPAHRRQAGQPAGIPEAPASTDPSLKYRQAGLPPVTGCWLRRAALRAVRQRPERCRGVLRRADPHDLPIPITGSGLFAGLDPKQSPRRSRGATWRSCARRCIRPPADSDSRVF